MPNAKVKPFVRRFQDHWTVTIPLPNLPYVIESHVSTWDEAIQVAIIRFTKQDRLEILAKLLLPPSYTSS